MEKLFFLETWKMNWGSAKATNHCGTFIWGRRVDVKTLQLCIGTAVASLMKGAQDKVNKGEVEPNLKLRAEERPRAEQIRSARRATEQL